jgi:hypothetical protein
VSCDSLYLCVLLVFLRRHDFSFGERWTGNSIGVRLHFDVHPGGWIRSGPSIGTLGDAMWHCSSCFFGDLSGFISKLTRWSELGATESLMKDQANLEKMQTDCSQSDHAATCRIWTDYAALPKFVQEHPEKWKNNGWTV